MSSGSQNERDDGGNPWGEPHLPDSQHFKPNVLFIDDDAYMRRLMSARLEHLGAEVESVASAAAALTHLQNHRPDVIISDAVMPAMDGFDLCRRLKADPLYQSIPFVILTALRGDLRQRSLQAGADDFLSKLEHEVVFRLRARLAFNLGVRLAALPGDPPTLEHAVLMVVSASKVIHAQLDSHLTKDGIIHVRSATTLAEALPMLQAAVPDAIALDLAFGQDEVLEWILQVRGWKDYADLPIMILAAKAEEPGLTVLEPYIQDRLPKPLDGQESRHRVNLLLRIAGI